VATAAIVFFPQEGTVSAHLVHASNTVKDVSGLVMASVMDGPANVFELHTIAKQTTAVLHVVDGVKRRGTLLQLEK